MNGPSRARVHCCSAEVPDRSSRQVASAHPAVPTEAWSAAPTADGPHPAAQATAWVETTTERSYIVLPQTLTMEIRLTKKRQKKDTEEFYREKTVIFLEFLKDFSDCRK